MKAMSPPPKLAALGLILLLGLSPWPSFAEEKAKPTASAAVTLFREQIRPILTSTCLTCHGGDKKKGGLDLTRRRGALAGGENGPALLPGKPAESLLYQKLTAGEMPPKEPLRPEQIAAFKKWIELGAPYDAEPLVAAIKRAGPDWWAFQPIVRPTVPRTKFDAVAKNPIDHFVFDKLAKSGLQPSAAADRLALLRRVTIDLTGLPPTPEEVETFINDKSAEAYEKVVDRLLASPAYGERWGRHWLDVIGYGESNGYEQNHLRASAWPYRDYIIRSFNEDKPYTDFIAEQLAGDLLGKGDPTIETATGFLVAGVHDTVGNQTVEGTLQQRANDLDHIVSTAGATFLGLTVGCARCHDHKFDPIPQKDYYRLAAVFAGVQHGERPVDSKPPSDKERRDAEEAGRQLRIVSGRLSDLDAEARAAVLRSQGIDPVPRPTVNNRRNVEDFTPVTARFVRFTVLETKDSAEPCIDEIEIYSSGSEENLALVSKGAKATASSVLPGSAIHQIHHLNDGKFGNEWSWISNERGGGWAQIELPGPASVSRIVWSRDSVDKPRYSDRLASAYRVEVSEDAKAWKTVVTGKDRAPSAEAIPAETLQNGLTSAQRKKRAELAAELEQLRRRDSAGSPVTAYIGQFTTPDTIHVLQRGDVMKRGDAVTSGALSELPGLSGELALDAKFGEPGRRLALARWIADPKNPLTARVIVNRVWHYHFGRGIVGTPSDFGLNGQKPSHPELLDWLASEFVTPLYPPLIKGGKLANPLLDKGETQGGWRLKPLHKMIVTSYTYCQSSASNPSGIAVDAGNQLLWRMPLRRMEAEIIRDSILAVSGKLDRKMGRPGFRLFKYRIVNVAVYDPLEEHGPETWRRSVYQQTPRAYREDLLANFDCPECAQRTPRRDVTTTPLQALSMLNGPFILQQAGFFAERVKREAGSPVAGVSDPGPSAQVDRAFRLAFGRSPSDEERKAAVEFSAKHGPPALCRALLNANEFVYY